MEDFADAVFASSEGRTKIFDVAKQQKRPVFMSAPMVRYSKLPFRNLVREYGVDVCYTPMILAKEFNRSCVARDSDLTTSSTDRPLTVQLACNSSFEAAHTALLLHPHITSINFNCGCPQTWACAAGIGASLLHSPELVCNMIRAVKNAVGEDFEVSVKIRVHNDLRRTVDFVKALENASADYIVVHGRTRAERTGVPVSLPAIKLVKETVGIPVVGNGDVFSLCDAYKMVEATGVDGVMAARGLQANPCMFAGISRTEERAVKRFVELCVRNPIPFALTRQHVWDMCSGGVMAKEERLRIPEMKDMLEMVDWIEERFADV